MLRILIALLCFAAAANAAETRKPKFIYYPVRGASAKNIRDDIVQNGPKIGGGSAFSFTIPAIKITRKTAQSAGQCRYRNYRISSVYSFVLPRLQPTKGLPRQTLANWNSFTTYLRDHENLHREIWLKCLSEFEAQAKTLEGSSCEALDKDTSSAFESKKRACLEEDKRLDFYYSKEALKTPFLREAMGK